ncbi:MAG: hypothetical protein J6U54_01760 [Clostridiales bacterium]|nr:hypothetical protein [Clostridiales bacterium]
MSYFTMLPDGKMADISFSNAQIKWTNFRGEERGKFNRAGDRNFNIVVPFDMANEFNSIGVAVGVRPNAKEAREALKFETDNKRCNTFEEKLNFLSSINVNCVDDITYTLKIIVSYKYPDKRPQIIRKGTATGTEQKIEESTVGMLDGDPILGIDMLVHPYFYGEGYTLYLKKAVVFVYESEFEKQYAAQFAGMNGMVYTDPVLPE